MNERQIVPNISDSRKTGVLSSSTAFFSNDLDSLKNLLFNQISKNDDPTLLRKLIIIPTDMIKEYLIQSFTFEKGLLFQMRFLKLPQLIQHLTKLSLPPSMEPKFPSHYTLSLHIEKEIRSLLESPAEEMLELQRYLQNNEKKLISLSQEMSHVYLHYGLYGSTALLDWEREKGWQQTLWKRLKTFWDFPCQLMTSEMTVPFKMEIHLFGLTNIPLLYRNYFDQLESSLPIYYYFKNPTPFYWGDTLSEKRRAKIDGLFQKKGISIQERLEFSEISQDTNPFVANLGQMGIPLFHHLSEKQSEEEYAVKEESSLLSTLQQEIFNLRPQKDSYTIDDSIEVHSAPTKLREIEILLHNLKRLYKQSPFTENQVVVLTPNVDDYYPYIEWVFGNDDIFGYNISSLSTPPPTSTLLTIRRFFSLLDGRFEPKELFTLLKSPAFLQKLPFTLEEVEYFEAVVRERGINWGFDLKERKELLHNNDLSDHGSWMRGFETLIKEIAHLSSTIELSKAELLGNFIAFIENLHTDLLNCKKNRPLSDWLILFEDLISSYFDFTEESLYFIKEIERLRDLSFAIDDPYSYTSIKRILHEIFHSKSYSARSQNGIPISFATIPEGSLPPVNILCLIGLDEDSFPKRATYRSINQLKKRKGCDPQVESPEKDRYSFLEALITPKDHLFISYVFLHEKDGKILNPSLLVKELFHHFKCDFTKKNPPTSFSKSIVQNEYYSKRDFQLAKAFFEKKGCEIPKIAAKEIEVKEINITNLFKLARHPLQFFCNESLGIYFGKEDEEKQKQSREFALSYLDKAILLNQALVQDENVVLKNAEETNLLPTALFRKGALFELQETIESMKENLSTLKLDRKEFFSLHLSPACSEIVFREHIAIAPALHLKDVTLYGKIDSVTKEGLFIHKEESFEELWKHYPLLLVLKMALPEIPTTLLFGKSATRRHIPIPNEEKSLLSYIEYYKEALKTASPLMPDRVEAYLKGDQERFTKLCLNTKTLFKDPYLEAIQPNLDSPWNSYLKDACSHLIV